MYSKANMKERDGSQADMKNSQIPTQKTANLYYFVLGFFLVQSEGTSWRSAPNAAGFETGKEEFGLMQNPN